MKNKSHLPKLGMIIDASTGQILALAMENFELEK